MHYPPVKANAKTGVPEPARLSEVFVGRIQGERLRAYLATNLRFCGGPRIPSTFTVSPLEGRTLRVAVLGFDTVAASNRDDPMVIRGRR